MIRPKRLEKGDTIGVVSPASPSENAYEIPRAVEYLENMGYRVVLGSNVNRTKGFTAASEKDRAADINEMFSRRDVDAVFVTQGGYGSAQLMKHIDFEVIRKNPKIFTGFSDITSLHLMINKLAGLVTFHSPGMARFNSEELTDYTKECFFNALTKCEPLGEIELPDKKNYLYTLSGGVAEGELIGGNLTLVCGSLGTPYEIDCKNKILFLEEVDTEPWMCDHQLSHLRNAGKLDDAAGFVIGDCKGCEPYEHNPGFLCDTSILDVFDYYLKPLNKPAIYGLPIGHTEDMATLPVGVRVSVDADSKKFTVLDSGVC